MGIEELINEAESIRRANGIDAAVGFYTAQIQRESNTEFGEQNGDLLAQLYNEMGFYKRIKKDFDGALKDYVFGLSWSSNNEIVAKININKADSLRFLGRLEEAHKSIDSAISYARKKVDNLIWAKAARQKGLIFVKEEKFAKALKQYLVAKNVIDDQINYEAVSSGQVHLEEMISPKTLRVKAEVLEPLGELYVRMGDVSKAKEAYALFKESLDISLKLDNEQNIVNAVRGLGKVAMMTGKPVEAILHYETAWNILQKTQYGRSITTTALLLAEAHLANNEPEKAKPYLERFLDDMRKLKLQDADNDHRKPHFENVQKYLPNSGLTIDKFEEVADLFS